MSSSNVRNQSIVVIKNDPQDQKVKDSILWGRIEIFTLSYMD